MQLALLTTTAFERDLKRARKQHQDLDKLDAVVTSLQSVASVGTAFAGTLPPSPPAWQLGRQLGLPRRTRLAAALQDDRVRTDPGAHRNAR